MYALEYICNYSVGNSCGKSGMTQYKAVLTPLLTHWSDCSIELSHGYCPLVIGFCVRKLIFSFVSKAAVVIPAKDKLTLQWRDNECHGVSNHQPHDYFLNRLFVRRSKKTSKFRVTGLRCKRPVTRKIFPFDDVIMRTGDVLSMNG